MFTILFDGISYGMLLFVLACGLAVTLGLMNIINLAHGAFAMAGGYVAALLMNRAGFNFFATLPLAFLTTAALGFLLERLLYIHIYQKPPLDQVLFTIGLVFMSVAGVTYMIGSDQQLITLPPSLSGEFAVLGVSLGRYRLFLVLICGALALGLHLLVSKTRFGARLRASVDDARVARGLGINVDALFAISFAFGSGLAGLGGALGGPMLGIDPTFPIKYMIYFLIVVTVGGTTGIIGPLTAALMLGIADVMGKYYIPALGGFFIYVLMIALLLLRPQGLFARGK